MAGLDQNLPFHHQSFHSIGGLPFYSITGLAAVMTEMSVKTP